MRDVRRRRTALADFDGFGIAHCPSGQLLDFRRNGCREQYRLAGARAAFDDLAHIRHKAHVQHSIRFIQNQDFDLVETQHAPLQLIEQPAGSRHYDIHTLPQHLILTSVSGAAE